jgi:superfamily II DNA or RNA helicase
MSYEKVKFKGEFRAYQAHVLQSVEKHNHDNKIHIVAAPGSGKTILGLELIRFHGKPALILSPSITIRQQWGQRLSESFLENTESLSDYLSFDLTKPKLMTCVTYQALHAALNKLVIPTEDDGSADDDQPSFTKLDFQGFDLFKTIKRAKIQTICLDEAHHLRSEWQKSLEVFIDAMQTDVNIIALTATPPYDSTPLEWERYIKVCGEIDEEISTPQLVAQKALCPHQDYVYFNYPTDKEMRVLSEHYVKIEHCINEILSDSVIDQLIAYSGLFSRNDQMSQLILDYPKEFVSILKLIHASGKDLPRFIIKLISYKGRLSELSIADAQVALDFIINHPQIFGEVNSEILFKTISKYQLIEKRRVNFTVNERVSRAIISSVGKLVSISEIVRNEYQSMKSSLRMLILTDYIRKDLVSLIGSNEPIESIGTVPIFETLRRVSDMRLKLAVVSGSLVIVADEILVELKKLSDDLSIVFSHKPIRNCGYSELKFPGSNKAKVALMTEAFQNGLIEVLIGTKSLLGEGWDSPSINSMILASFVGTFMISNQMRGRAIRIDPRQPDKTANIWHLVTIEPTHLLTHNLFKKLISSVLVGDRKAEGVDFELMNRRFKTFYAPSFEEESIENGLQRLTPIKPPYTHENIQLINEQMIAMSNNRVGLSEKWQGIIKDNHFPEIVDVSEISKKVVPTKFVFANLLNPTLVVTFSLVFHRIVIQGLFQHGSMPSLVSGSVFLLVSLMYVSNALNRILRFISPTRTIKTLGDCILRTLVDMGEIKSLKARFVVQSDKSKVALTCALVDATTYEKTIFAKAISELLTYIDNPRYLLIKQYTILFLTIKDYSQSYACPSIISVKKEYVEILQDHLQSKAGQFKIQFTRSEEGRKMLLKCRRMSYINLNEIFIKGKKIIRNKWE